MASRPTDIIRAFHDGKAELSEQMIERALQISPAQQAAANLTALLRRFGNHNFAFANTTFHEVREILRCLDPQPGQLFCDAGAGYGHMVFYVACVTACRVRAIEIVPRRCAAMLQTGRHLGIANVDIVQADALAQGYGDVSYLFLNNPFFPDRATQFVAKLAVSGAPGMTVIAINNIVDALRGNAAFKERDVEADIPNYRFGIFRLTNLRGRSRNPRHHR